jgi:hypothetical protein
MVDGIEEAYLVSSSSNLLGHGFTVFKVDAVYATDIDYWQTVDILSRIGLNFEDLAILESNCARFWRLGLCETHLQDYSDCLLEQVKNGVNLLK